MKYIHDVSYGVEIKSLISSIAFSEILILQRGFRQQAEKRKI